MANDPQLWEQHEDYRDALEVVKDLRVVNDTAERGIALVQEYNGLLVKDPEQHEFLLRLVHDHRKRFPEAKKSNMLFEVLSIHFFVLTLNHLS